MTRRSPFAPLLGPALLLLAALAPLEAEDRWPHWRGPEGTGAADGDPPIEWSETKNVAWKVPLPGLGSSTPVVWGDQLILTAAVDTGKTPGGEVGEKDRVGRSPGNVHEWVLVSYASDDGSEKWRKVLGSGVPVEGNHPTATWASASPVTDGEVLLAYFGSMGLWATDLDGNVLWERDFGTMNKRNGFGEGASPALYRDRVVVQWDHEGDSYLIVLDKKTGEEVWRRDRDEISTWSTPLVVEHGDRVQVVTNGTNKVRSYDLLTGDLVWEASGMTLNAIPTPIHKDGIVYVTSGFRGAALYAIGLEGAHGDITESASVLWKYMADTPYVSTPLLYQDVLYFTKVLSPILTAVSAKDGRVLYGPERIELDNIYASPVGAAGRVYFVGREGAAVVLRAGPKLEVLATNQLDDRFDASPAVLGDRLYLRGHESLYCLARPE